MVFQRTLLISWGFLSLIFYFAYLMIDSLAGQETQANIGISMFFDWRSLGILLGAGGIAYGWRERRLRQSTVQRLQPRIQELERLLDPGRTTSLLTEKGETNPEDV